MRLSILPYIAHTARIPSSILWILRAPTRDTYMFSKCALQRKTTEIKATKNKKQVRNNNNKKKQLDNESDAESKNDRNYENRY